MVMATDQANVFRCGASVAPVTDWTRYDTLYTERYMGLEPDNRDGYRNGSLTEKALGLRNKTYYLVHGTGDDNVHFQMSMELARRLELADIEFEQMVCVMASVQPSNQRINLQSVLRCTRMRIIHCKTCCRTSIGI